MKYVASAQECICEQWVRPSQLNCAVVGIGAGDVEVTVAAGAALDAATGVLIDLYFP